MSLGSISFNDLIMVAPTSLIMNQYICLILREGSLINSLKDLSDDDY